MNKRILVGIIIVVLCSIGVLGYGLTKGIYKKQGNDIEVSGQTFQGAGTIYRSSIRFIGEEERQYGISTDYGCLYELDADIEGEIFMTETTRENGDGVLWDFCHFDTEYFLTEEDLNGEKIYVDIIEYEDEYIVGFAVVEMVPNELFSVFEPKIVKHIHFPKKFNQYQDITLEYIQEQMERIKN